MKRTLSLFLLLAALGCSAQNGWEISSRYYNSLENPNDARVETVSLYNGFMKTVIGDLVTVFSIQKGEILYYNNSTMGYWQGSTSRFNRDVRAEMEVIIEQQLLDVPHDEQEAMRIMYREMLDATLTGNIDPSLYPSYATRREGKGERIVGYDTEIYVVLENNQATEKIWIAPDLPVAQDFDFINMSHFLTNLASGSFGGSFESSQEYFKLLQKGYPLKVIIPRADGYTYISEVIEATRVELTPKDFDVPSNYSPASLTEVGVWDTFQ